MKQKYLNKLSQFKSFFISGFTPTKLAITISLGIVAGLFPVIGLTSILCLIIGIALKLNIVLLQLTNWLLAPIQLLLIVPFYQIGLFIFGSSSNQTELVVLQNIFKADFSKSFEAIVNMELLAICGWAISTLPIAAVCYVIIGKFAKRKVQQTPVK
ncbi:MAG: DUF2062 domain-containing protein [Bacteroidia bacterium]